MALTVTCCSEQGVWPTQLKLLIEYTNEGLQRNNKVKKAKGEILTILRVLILITCFEFGQRATDWFHIPPRKYILAPALGNTGMGRQRFDVLWRHVAIACSPPLPHQRCQVRSLGEPWLKTTCKLLPTPQKLFTPSDLLCVDESMSRWYGQGGICLNLRLPQCISIDCKPENGCEIHNFARERNGVMMGLKLVKTAQHENAHPQEMKKG